MTVQLPPRPADGHKGTFGRVLIIAGSPGMSGAACLAGTAALRSGSGLVTVAVPESIQAIIAGYEPSYMTIGMPCDNEGQLHRSALANIASMVADFDAVAVGPGLGQSDTAAELVQMLIRDVGVPLTLDADALNIVAEHAIDLRQRSHSTIVTPHPGEFARLTGRSIDAISQDRPGLSRELAEGNGVICVLKGPRTIVTDGARQFENTTGNAGMATGGTGDVLTGMIVSLCGQRMDPFDAAVTAVYAHGLAGDLCATAESAQGLISSDLPRWLPAVWARMNDGTGR